MAQGEPVKRGGWFNTAYGDGKAKINFIAREAGDFDALWRSLQGNAKNAKATDVKEEDIAARKGKLLTFSTPEKDPKHVVSMMVRGEKYILECEAEYRASAPKPELVEACKTMHEP